jgi:hypothetical protein
LAGSPRQIASDGVIAIPAPKPFNDFPLGIDALGDKHMRTAAPEETGAALDRSEARMRRALGLDAQRRGPEPSRKPEQKRPVPAQRAFDQPSPNRRPRRFVQDGDVPVVLIHGQANPASDAAASPANRVEAAEAATKAAQLALADAERLLQGMRKTVHDLETKLGHAELARSEAKRLRQPGGMSKV